MAELTIAKIAINGCVKSMSCMSNIFPKKPVKGGIPANERSAISAETPSSGFLKPNPLSPEISSSSEFVV